MKLKRYEKLFESQNKKAIIHTNQGKERVDIDDIYTVQSYINQDIVNKKIKNNDYTVYVDLFDDDGEKVWMVVDGHHSLEAAFQSGTDPIFVEANIIESKLKDNLERYVMSFNDLDEPISIQSKRRLW